MDYCVIDIGSNSVRMLLDGVKTLVTTRLGEGLANGGGLTAAAVARTLDTLERFVSAARECGAYPVAFATSAVREAPNRDGFLAAVRERCGIDVRVLTGEDEARLAFTGAAPETGGLHCVLDVGGGSAEVVMGRHGAEQPPVSASIQAGAVRLCGVFPLGDPPDKHAATRMLAHTEDAYRGILDAFPEKPATFTAIGGTATSLAAMNMAMAVYDAGRVQGYTLRRADLDGWYQRLLGMNLNERRAIPGLQYARADVIIGGAASILAFTRVFGVQALCVSDSDNLEAVYTLLLDGAWPGRTE